MGCGSISKVYDTVDVNEQEVDENFPADVSLDEPMEPESTIVQQSIIRPMNINCIDTKVTIVGTSSSSSGMVLSDEAIAIQQLTQDEQIIQDVSSSAAKEEATPKERCRNSDVSMAPGDKQVDAKLAAGDALGNSTRLTSLESTALVESAFDKTVVQIIGAHVISTASGTSYAIKFSDGKIKPLSPEGYPLPLDLEHPWDYEQSLHYSIEWKDKGSYKLLPLQGEEQQDFVFVSKLFAKSVAAELGDGYEISDVTLISDEGDEQAFVAELDLLEKKHGNLVHKAKWKPKNQDAAQHENEEVVAARTEYRTKLKALRYRTHNVPHIKLLPLWHGTTIEQIAALKGASLSNLSYAEEGKIGKGYYGKGNAIVAYNEAKMQHEDEQVILMLSWYAGKTVYPAIDQDKLAGQPHYANHDLHYSVTAEGHHTAVVFDPGQILPRYLVSIKKRGAVNLDLTEQLQTIKYVNPGKRPLLFQANFSNAIATIAKKRFAALATSNLVSNNEHDYKMTSYLKEIKDKVRKFLMEPTKEVLLLKILDNASGKLLSGFLEMMLWHSYEEGKPIPFYLQLSESFAVERGLIEAGLAACGVDPQVIEDLKDKRKEFTFIINYYEQVKKIPLIKSNLLNRYGGFKGKSIVIVPEGFDYEDDLFYPEGGNKDQQAAKLEKIDLLELSQEEKTIHSYIRKKLKANQYKALSVEESYVVATVLQHNLLPTPGGELRPWEYSNALQHSIEWQDKGAFKIHHLKPSDPDYDFVAKLYAQTRMPDYELDKVFVISDRGAEQAFVANLNTLERRATPKDQSPLWLQEDQEAARTQFRTTSIELLEQNSYKTELTQSVKLLPLWHGTGPDAAAGIAKSGFASLALVDAGYFGKGLYGSSSAEYSYRVYARGYHKENGLLILSWYSAQNVYPVVKWDTYPGLAENDCEIYLTTELPKNIKEAVTPTIVYDSSGTIKQLIISKEEEQQDKNKIIVKKTLESSDLQLNEQSSLLLKEFIADNKKFAKVLLKPTHSVLKLILAQGHTRKIEDKLLGKPNYQNYDSHWVRVKPANIDKHRIGTEDTYYPIGTGEEHEETYQEFVTFPTAQVLPRYILSLKKEQTDESLPGMDKFLEKAASSGNTSLYKQSLTGMIAALKQSAKNERDQDYMLTQGLSLYIPSQASNSDNIENVAEKDQYRLEDKTKEFITTAGKELWLLQGNAGSGKSLFGRHLEQDLWSKYKESDLIPLFIPLPRIGDLSRVDDLIAKALELKGLSTDAIKELKAKKRFLFILDGYDEIPGKPKLLRKYRFNEEGSWQGKIIVGCRLQYLSAEEEKLLYPKHAGETLTQSIERCMKSYIIPFNPNQVNDYTERFCDSKFNKNDDGSKKWSITQYQEKIAEFKEISEFLKEPFLLFLVLSVLPHLSEKFISSKPITEVVTESSDVNATSLVEFIASSVTIKKIDLYDAFTESWFKSQFERMTQHYARDLSNYTSQDILNIFRKYAKELAFKMFLEETQITTHPLDKEFGKFFIGSDGDEKRKEIAELGFQGSPLKRIGESYLFMHKSFQEYFVARKILDELEDCTAVESVPSLQQKLITDPAILTFISNKLPLTGKESLKLQENLFKIIENSSFTKIPQYSQAAANAATILNFARIAFSGRNFKGISIPGADLTGAILDHTNLEEADLSYVKLQSAWLTLANLKNANLTGAIFGELAYKELGNTVAECKYSPDGKYFAATTDLKTTTIYKVEKTGSLTEVDSSDPSAYGFQTNSATSPNGQYCATINYKDIELYKIDESGKKTLINTLTGHTDYVYSVTFSPDNQWLASGSEDHTVHLWSLSDPTKTQTLTGHTSAVRSVTFSPDNQWLASGSDDHTVRLWSLSDPTKTQTLTGHTNIVRSVTFSPDNQWLASGSYDRTVHLWSLSDPTKTQTLTGHTESVTSVTFSPDNQWLASGSWDKTVHLWSLSDPTKTQTLTGHTDYVYSVTFSPDNQWLASGSLDHTVHLWSLSDPTKTQTLTGHTSAVTSVTFSPDNQWLASGSYDETVHLWSLSDPTKTQTLTGHTSYVSSVTFSPDNQWLASGSWDKTVRLWSLSDPTKTQTLTGHTQSVSSVTFSPDNQWLASGSADQTVRLWTKDTSGNWRSQFSVKTNFKIYSLSYTAIDNHLYLSTGGDDCSVRLWEQLPDKLILLWNTHPNKLFPAQADLTAATLSATNSELLLQRGATGEPKITELPDEPQSPPHKPLLFSKQPLPPLNLSDSREQSLATKPQNQCTLKDKL